MKENTFSGEIGSFLANAMHAHLISVKWIWMQGFWFALFVLPT